MAIIVDRILSYVGLQGNVVCVSIFCSIAYCIRLTIASGIRMQQARIGCIPTSADDNVLSTVPDIGGSTVLSTVHGCAPRRMNSNANE
jgi:hypothetical protein